MIKRLLFPQKIGSYFLFSESFVGLEIQNNAVFACKLTVSGTNATINKWLTESVPQEEIVSDEALINALKKIKQQAGSVDEYVLSIPTSLVIFKELTLPFLDKEQIELVLPFEIEALIPFPVDQAFFDCIITKQDLVTKQSTVLVAIVQQENLTYYQNLVSAAGIELSVITVDLLNIHYAATVLKTPVYGEQGNILLVLYGTSTSVAYCAGNQIRFVRTINKGLQTLLRNYANTHKLPYATVAQQAAGEGLEADKLLQDYLAEIQFSLQNLPLGTLEFPMVQRIIIAYNTPLFIANLTTLIAQTLNTEALLFESAQLESVQNLTLPVQSLDYRALIVAAAVLPAPVEKTCNLLRLTQRMKEADLVAYQVLTAGVLALTLMISIFAYSWYATGRAKTRINSARQQLVTQLTTQFEIERGKTKTPESLLRDAQSKIEEEGKIWFALSGKYKTSYLQLLHELTKLVDREATKLRIKRLALSDTEVQLSGSVPGYPELRMLEEELRSSTVFTLKNIPQEPTFDLTLIIKKQGGL